MSLQSRFGPLNTKSTTYLNTDYRQDIDGLRAIAVIAVVIYHAFPTLMPSGFIGVDIFFVISGFLITNIILTQLHKKSFSLVEFYKRRIRRIFPALLLVLGTCFLAGWHLMTEEEFTLLGQHIIGGIASVSNLVLLKEANYFDTSAETKPLLHLWSLGVEEQFYLIWPLLLLLFTRNIKLAWTFFIALICISFTANVIFINKYPTAVFYLPFTRIWELAFGSILSLWRLHGQQLQFFFKEKKINLTPNILTPKMLSFFSAAGFSLLCLGFYSIDDQDAFPGWLAILPVFGTTLIIFSGPQAWLNRKLLSAKYLVFIGLISYPLYLWHWPLLTFARLLYGGESSISIRLGLILAAFFLSIATYKLIEIPLRKGSDKPVVIVLLGIAVLLLAMGANIYTRDGLSFRNAVEVNTVGLNQKFETIEPFMIKECGLDSQDFALFSKCQTDNRTQAKYALMGDSKAAALFPGLVRTSTENGRWLFIGGTGAEGAPIPLLSKTDYPAKYYKLTATAIDAITRNEAIEVVVIAAAMRTLFNISDKNDDTLKGKYNYQYLEQLSNTPHRKIVFDGFTEVIDRLIQTGKQVILIEDNPALPTAFTCGVRVTQFKIINTCIEQKPQHKLAECSLSIDAFKTQKKVYDKLLNKIVALYPKNVSIFSTIEFLCDQQKNTCNQEKNGQRLYSYTDHLSDYSAQVIGEALNKTLNLNNSEIERLSH